MRYNYPFASIAKESGVRIQSGFDIQAAIDKTKGTILEVGGPSIDGFFFLQDCTLPRRPIITNLNYRASMTDKTYRTLYTPYIEKRFDIRKNVLKPQSVGICLASCLNLIAKEPRFRNNRRAWQKKRQELANEEKLLHQDPKTIPKVGLRFILVRQARTFLEPGGLLIIESLREQELKYSLALGFSLRAATKPHKSHDATVYQSIVLQQ